MKIQQNEKKNMFLYFSSYLFLCLFQIKVLKFANCEVIFFIINKLKYLNIRLYMYKKKN